MYDVYKQRRFIQYWQNIRPRTRACRCRYSRLFPLVTADDRRLTSVHGFLTIAKDGTPGVVLNFAIHICGSAKEMSILPSTPVVTGNDLRTPVNKGLQKVNALKMADAVMFVLKLTIFAATNRRYLVSQHTHWSQHSVLTKGTDSLPQKRQCSPGIGVASIRLYVIGSSPCLLQCHT